MKSFAAILAFLAFCSPSLAQNKPDVQLPANVRMYEPKNLTPDRASLVAIFVRNLLNLPGLYLNWDNVPHAFVIRDGNPQNIDTAEALLKRFDVPEPRVELTVYLIRALLPSSPAVPGAPVNAIPSDLKTAIDEMMGSFNYDRYSLWDTILLQPKGNGGEVQGILPAETGAKNYVYTVSYGINGGVPTEGKTLNLANFTFSIKMPQSLPVRMTQGKEDVESHIRTDITVHEGQKLVLGKIRLLPSANADLFLVLTTKVY
jgi:hypothetical protein